jgi:hypothetical protein
MVTIRCDHKDPRDDMMRCVATRAPHKVQRTGTLPGGTPFIAWSHYCDKHKPDQGTP